MIQGFSNFLSANLTQRSSSDLHWFIWGCGCLFDWWGSLRAFKSKFLFVRLSHTECSAIYLEVAWFNTDMMTSIAAFFFTKS